MNGYIKQIREKIGHDEIILVGAGVFIYEGRNILLQKRRDTSTWSLHGGGVEIGETVEAAARRELFEETGLTANTLEFLGVFSGEDMRFTYPNGDQVYIIAIDYACCDYSGECLPETEETLELKWFLIDNLPEEILKTDLQAFRAMVDFLNKKFPKEG